MSQSSSIKDTIAKLSTGQRIGYAVLLPAWVFVSFMAVQLLLSGILIGLQYAGIDISGVLDNAIFSMSFSAIIYVLTLALVIGGPWLALKRKTTKEELGLQRSVAWKDLLIAPSGLITYFFITAVLTTIAMHTLLFIDFNQEQDVGFSGLTFQYEYVLAFLTLVVIAPVAEEVLFRGYLFGKLRAVIPTWVAVLIVSLLFGAVHMAWNVGIDTFALSIVLCLVTIISKSLWPAIMIHMMKNFIAFYFLFINPTLLTTIGG